VACSAVVLRDDVPSPLVTEPRNRLVLAGGEQRIHVRGAELELDDLLAVEPVLAVVAPEHDPRAVPLSHGAQVLALVGRDQIVQRGGAVARQLAVLVAVVVEDLILETEGGVSGPASGARAPW